MATFILPLCGYVWVAHSLYYPKDKENYNKEYHRFYRPHLSVIILILLKWILSYDFRYLSLDKTAIIHQVTTMLATSKNVLFPGHKGKGKGICLESRYPRYTCSSDFTFPLAVGAYCSLQLSIQPWICAPGTHYGWGDRGSVVYEVCQTLLHMASTWNRTPDLLI